MLGTCGVEVSYVAKVRPKKKKGDSIVEDVPTCIQHHGVGAGFFSNPWCFYCSTILCLFQFVRCRLIVGGAIKGCPTETQRVICSQSACLRMNPFSRFPLVLQAKSHDTIQRFQLLLVVATCHSNETRDQIVSRIERFGSQKYHSLGTFLRVVFVALEVNFLQFSIDLESCFGVVSLGF